MQCVVFGAHDVTTVQKKEENETIRATFKTNEKGITTIGRVAPLSSTLYYPKQYYRSISSETCKNLWNSKVPTPRTYVHGCTDFYEFFRL